MIPYISLPEIAYLTAKNTISKTWGYTLCYMEISFANYIDILTVI